MNSGMLTRLREALGISEREPVDSGLNRINSQLGLDRSTQSHEPRKAASIQVEATAAHPRSIFFGVAAADLADARLRCYYVQVTYFPGALVGAGRTLGSLFEYQRRALSSFLARGFAGHVRRVCF